MDVARRVNLMIISENNYLITGVKSLIADNNLFYGCELFFFQFRRLPKAFFEQLNSIDNHKNFIITERNTYCYLLTKSKVKNTWVIKSDSKIESYLDYFRSKNVQVSTKKIISPFERLSPQEFTIFTLFAAGNIDENVANELGLSKKTVSGHRRNILKKLNLGNRYQLYLFALESKDFCREYI
ncbi:MULTISPECIES: LuxR C-terminal-related transcriptional regulator [Enterobacter]|uniref:LuxR C-terminal-related transcriptional regulator n=1 Tax=Enterobacter TaxID=547 RepID=UPI0013D56679|nr:MULTISPECIES: LuxR C-terminal-related transcriptional regulator [Enterobacter]NEV85080.1 response regulator transcription factor [Enterobacter asburiae]NMD68618.1 response regulator transcription factor [Enterobacter sp. DNRA5]